MPREGWRDAVLKAWSKTPANKRLQMCVCVCVLAGGDPKDAEVRDAAKTAHQVLAHACRSMTSTKTEEKRYWSTHVNRNVNHHSGWLPLMQRAKILAKTSKAGSGVLTFGSKEVYKLASFDAARHVPVLGHMSMMQQNIAGYKTPKTLDEWNAGMESFRRVAKNKVTATGYSHRWLYRSAMMAEMHVTGVKNLGPYR